MLSSFAQNVFFQNLILINKYYLRGLLTLVENEAFLLV